LHICLVRIVAYVSMSMPFEMTITDLPFAEEAWRHVPCAICNYLGWPEYEVHGMWLTCKSVRRWAYFPWLRWTIVANDSWASASVSDNASDSHAQDDHRAGSISCGGWHDWSGWKQRSSSVPSSTHPMRQPLLAPGAADASGGLTDSRLFQPPTQGSRRQCGCFSRQRGSPP
jgi:hypothetical protein